MGTCRPVIVISFSVVKDYLLLALYLYHSFCLCNQYILYNRSRKKLSSYRIIYYITLYSNSARTDCKYNDHNILIILLRT